MSISFLSVPTNLLTPGAFIEYDNSRAVSGAVTGARRTVAIGQMLTAGTATADTPVQVTSVANAEALFGRGSILAEMCKSFKRVTEFADLWAVPLDDDGGAVDATGTLTVTGAATASGTVFLYIAGKQIQVGVASGDTVTDVADSISAAVISATNDHLPVSAMNTAGVVTLTARNGGTVGNDVDLRFNYNQGEAFPAGISIAIVAMASGATDPSIAAGIASLAGVWYQTWLLGLSGDTEIAALEAELDTRWGPTVQQDGQAFFGLVDTHANLITKGASRNSQFSTISGVEGTPTPHWIIASMVGAIDENQSANDPARPRQFTQLPTEVGSDSMGIRPPADADLFSQSENNLLLDGGISTLVFNVGNSLIQRIVTTYQTNVAGAPDPSYLDITTMRTLAFLRETVRNRFLLRFPNFKLAQDGTAFAPGQPVLTPSVARSEFLNLFREWEELALVEDFEQFKDEIIVEISSTDPNRLEARLGPNLINQFRVLAGQIQFIL